LTITPMGPGYASNYQINKPKRQLDRPDHGKSTISDHQFLPNINAHIDSRLHKY